VTCFGGFSSPRRRPSPQACFVSLTPSLESTFPRLTIFFEPQGGHECESIVIDPDPNTIRKCEITRGSTTNAKVQAFVDKARLSAGIQVDHGKRDFSLLTVHTDPRQPGVRFHDTSVPLPKDSQACAAIDIAERTAYIQLVFPTEPRNIPVIDFWTFLVYDLRNNADPACGRINNWWYSNQTNFDLTRFGALNGLGGFDLWANNNEAPPQFPWTEIITNKAITQAQVYPAMIDLDLRPQFPNLRVFESLMLPGLLWERDHPKEVYQRQFNNETPYKVVTNRSNQRV
jgi:hypothetical protein